MDKELHEETKCYLLCVAFLRFHILPFLLPFLSKIVKSKSILTQDSSLYSGPKPVGDPKHKREIHTRRSTHNVIQTPSFHPGKASEMSSIRCATK